MTHDVSGPFQLSTFSYLLSSLHFWTWWHAQWKEKIHNKSHQICLRTCEFLFYGAKNLKNGTYFQFLK